MTSGFKGNKVEFAPEHIWKTGASLRGKNLSFTFNYSYISDQFSDANNTEYTETGNQGPIPSYTVLDFSGKYMVPKYGLALSVGVNNMLNNVIFYSESYKLSRSWYYSWRTDPLVRLSRIQNSKIRTVRKIKY